MYGQRYEQVSSRKCTQLPKSCVISCTNAHPLHICLIGSHISLTARGNELCSCTQCTDNPSSLLFQSLSCLFQLLLAPFLFFRGSWSASQSQQQGVTIPRGRHTGYIPAERVHATWASSNTTMGLICSPYETSSLYFLS